MTEKKIDFLQNEYLETLSKIPKDRKGIFGKMNVHQMIEHMTWAFKIANGKVKIKNQNSPEVIEKMHRFLMSDKSFRDNTPNANLPDNPLPPISESVNEAIDLLAIEIGDMIKVYENQPSLRIENPFFGQLNFEEQVQLLHKHAMHHLRQFGVMPN